MNLAQNTYKISHKEMIRRGQAFSLLLISLLVFGFIFSVLFITANILILIAIFAILAIISLFIIFVFTRYFRAYQTIEIVLSSDEILRNWQANKEKWEYQDIKSITIKMTTNKTPREVRIALNTGSVVIINGLNNFDDFEHDIVSRISSDKIKYIKEPIDFDHPLFYPILGFILSFLTASSIKILSVLDSSSIQIYYYFMLAFNTGLCLYFIAKKPLTKVSKKSRVSPDYVFSVVLISVSLLVFFLTR